MEVRATNPSLQRVNSVKRAVLIPQKTTLRFDLNPISDNEPSGGGLTGRKASGLNLRQDSSKHSQPALSRVSSRYSQVLPPNPTSEASSESVLIEKFLEQVHPVNITKQDSIIMRTRILEEMMRIHERNQITQEERTRLFQIAMSMDAPKLARKLVADAKDRVHEDEGGGVDDGGGVAFLTGAAPAFPSSSAPKSLHRPPSSGSMTDDVRFVQAVDEVERIRQRILQRASLPLSTAPNPAQHAASSLISQSKSSDNAASLPSLGDFSFVSVVTPRSRRGSNE
eukprot:gene46666-57151_t